MNFIWGVTKCEKWQIMIKQPAALIQKRVVKKIFFFLQFLKIVQVIHSVETTLNKKVFEMSLFRLG
jgi:hypothetical protein